MADTSLADQRTIRDRVSSWESKTDPKAPLTTDQRDVIHEISLIAAQRRFPTNVSVWQNSDLQVKREQDYCNTRPRSRSRLSKSRLGSTTLLLPSE